MPTAARTRVPFRIVSWRSWTARHVRFDRDLAIRRIVDRLLKSRGWARRGGLQFDNIENIKQAVAIGAGVALLPEPTLRREVKAGTLVGRAFVRRSDQRVRSASYIGGGQRPRSAACRLSIYSAEPDAAPLFRADRRGKRPSTASPIPKNGLKK